jgi:phosphohistidine phosphatase SixA
VTALLPFRPERLVSSPYLRCRQTVEPLAAALGLSLEEANELAEGAGREQMLRFVQRLGNATAILCTHGDLVEELLGDESEKGSTWVLAVENGEVKRLEYLPPLA